MIVIHVNLLCQFLCCLRFLRLIMSTTSRLVFLQPVSLLSLAWNSETPAILLSNCNPGLAESCREMSGVTAFSSSYQRAKSHALIKVKWRSNPYSLASYPQPNLDTVSGTEKEGCEFKNSPTKTSRCLQRVPKHETGHMLLNALPWL